jgi:hypothetical protein
MNYYAGIDVSLSPFSAPLVNDSSTSLPWVSYIISKLRPEHK